ncbi:competence protein CoiA family protein [Terrabacter sp. 2YAF2]|uniref:competence protein CoiA family protein n=1 Tax=Terrabacter sp. 2YAF2 TaxID=3233026 RepID=UPI003F959DA1
MPQIFAKWSADPDRPLFKLPIGSADEVRQDVNAGALICPIHDCANPLLRVRGKSRRDHFAHRALDEGHGRETLAHHTSKHLIAQRLRELYPDAQVHPDTKETEDGARPDVYVVLDDGTQLAYEVQFAHLTPEDWQRRHDRYAAANVKDVWLFGGPTYLRTPTDRDTTARWLSFFDTVLEGNRPILFIDPMSERLGVAHADRARDVLAVHNRSMVWPQDETAVRWSTLGQTTAARGVLLPPGLPELYAAARVREPQLRAEQANREAAARDAQRRAARLTSAPARNREMADLDAPVWQYERGRLEQRQGFPFPDVVDQTPTEDELNAGLLGDQWRIAVLRMLGAHAGKSVHIGRPLAIVLDCRRGEEAVPALHSSLRRYLDLLEAGRWVRRVERGRGKHKDERVEVLFSLYDPPPTWAAGCRMRVWPDPPIVEFQLHGPGGELVVREVDRQHNVSLEQTIPFYPSQFTARGGKRLKSAARKRRRRW